MADAAPPTPDFAIAVAQFAPGADAEANLAEITRLTELAAARGARLVVFPEYSSYFTPEPGWDWHAAAETVGGRFTEHLSALSTRLDLHVVAGMIERLDGDERRVANTVVAVDRRRGWSRATASSTSTTRSASASRTGSSRARSRRRRLFEAGGIRFGLQTCYDLRFPEVTRRSPTRAPMSCACPPSGCAGRSRSTTGGCSRRRAPSRTPCTSPRPTTPRRSASGNSMIVDPQGVELATIGEATDVAVAWISRARIDAVRRINPALALRRFDVTERVADPRDPR